jgi:LysM repeat protein
LLKKSQFKEIPLSTIIYVVTAGESLSQIASHYKRTLDQVLAANPQLDNLNLIVFGRP